MLFWSDDYGASFDQVKLFGPAADQPHTGISLERFTGHNFVSLPWILFSTGPKGPDVFGKGLFHRVHTVQLDRNFPGFRRHTVPMKVKCW